MRRRVAAVSFSIIVIIGVAVTFVLFFQKPAGLNEIKVGAMVFLTGPQAPLGEEVNNALRLGVSKTNARVGVDGSKIDLLVQDSKDSPRDTIATFKQVLIDDPLTIISTGDVVSLNLAPLATERGLPRVATAGGGFVR